MNRLDTIALFSVGGTFNKIYNPLSGDLEIDPEARALRELGEKWLCDFELHTLIHKDSLQMNAEDRLELARTIEASRRRKILVVHGTDTIDTTAAMLARHLPSRQIVLTGAMIPYSIDPVEATANFASAVGWLLGNDDRGVRIALHGLILPYDQVVKDRALGRFVPRRS